MSRLFVRGNRLKRLQSLPHNIMVHNLAKGIPFPSDSVDVVYHSHLLEHLDRAVVRQFLLEIHRVLKPGGILRIVIPDFEKLCKTYLSHLTICEHDAEESSKHDAYIASIIEQCVRKEGTGAREQPPLRRFIENAVIGDARARGETHQWMYDRISLISLLNNLGFRNTQLQAFNSSLITNWISYRLDVDEQGKEYKPQSLYVEAQK
jgi:SAM-dependent methyltransferase